MLNKDLQRSRIDWQNTHNRRNWFRVNYYDDDDDDDGERITAAAAASVN